MALVDILVFGLATWRVSSLLVNEKGPWEVFFKLRTWAGIEEMRLGDSPEVYKSVPDTFLAQALNCPWCCSLWVGLGWTGVYFLAREGAVWIALPFALSAMGIMIEVVIKRTVGVES